MTPTNIKPNIRIQTKEYILYDDVYIKFQSRRNQALIFRDVHFNDKTINKSKETKSPKKTVVSFVEKPRNND